MNPPWQANACNNAFYLSRTRHLSCSEVWWPWDSAANLQEHCLRAGGVVVWVWGGRGVWCGGRKHVLPYFWTRPRRILRVERRMCIGCIGAAVGSGSWLTAREEWEGWCFYQLVCVIASAVSACSECLSYLQGAKAVLPCNYSFPADPCTGALPLFAGMMVHKFMLATPPHQHGISVLSCSCIANVSCS
jgi:hypothetical protein